MVTINLDAQINKVQQKIERTLKSVVQGVAYQMTATIGSYVGFGQGGSPIWTGQYIDSHRVSLNSVDKSFKPHFGERNKVEPREGSLTNSYVSSVISGYQLGDTINISNSVPHAREVEQGTKTAPQGVYEVSVKVAIAKVPQTIASAVRAFDRF